LTDILRSTRGKKICFIRFVERWSEEEFRCGFVVFNRFVDVPSEYNNQYVFVALNLATATLHILSEWEGIVTEIFNQPFPFTV